MTIPKTCEISKSTIAALLMLGKKLLPSWRAWPPTNDEIIALAGADRSQAYESAGRLRELLPTLQGQPGRPCRPQGESSRELELASAIRDFLMDHPGAVCGHGERRAYSDDLRRFVLDLRVPDEVDGGLPLNGFSRATGIPLGTLKGWIYLDTTPPVLPTVAQDAPVTMARDDAHPDTETPAETVPPAHNPASAVHTNQPTIPDPATLADLTSNPQLQTILALFPSWHGSFKDFCEYLRTEHQIAHGDTFIANVLVSFGLRKRQRQQPVEAPWSHDTYRLLFPGAQWSADGKAIAIRWNGTCYAFNLEAVVDTASNATVGFTLTDAEDEQALLSAFRQGITSAGTPPIGLTIDQRPSNISAMAEVATAGTIPILATKGRGQAKPYSEGEFGLLEQTVPPLLISGQTQRECARSALELALNCYYRGRNGKPRPRLGGRTPIQAYRDAQPTPEEIQEAREVFLEYIRRQELASRTREARQDPVRRQLLIEGLAQIGIPDPDNRLATDLACFSREAIQQGLAAFQTRRDMGKIPAALADHDRYLAGIIRNIDTRLETASLFEYLLEQRLRHRDLCLAPLTQVAEQIVSTTPPEDLPKAFLDRALTAIYEIEFRFWTREMREALAARPAEARIEMARYLARRVGYAAKIKKKEWVAILIAELTEAAVRVA